MQTASGITDIAHGIQLSVAPVFLLTGVGTLLGVLTNRLGRIIDRARRLESAVPVMSEETVAAARAELQVLSRRARLVHRAITLATTCALLICVVIVSLFAGVALSQDLSPLIVILFTMALAAFIGALLSFLFEIRAATTGLHFDIRPPAP
jgi:hypothetical protein